MVYLTVVLLSASHYIQLIITGVVTLKIAALTQLPIHIKWLQLLSKL